MKSNIPQQYQQAPHDGGGGNQGTPIDHAKQMNTLTKLETAFALPRILGFEPHYTMPEPRTKDRLRRGWQRVARSRRQLLAGLDPALGASTYELGIALGPNSNWLVRVDADQSEAAAILRELLPPTGMVTGRRGAPESGLWYCITGHTEAVAKKIAVGFEPLKTLTLADGTPRRTKLVELLTAGQQSLIPPSRHPTDPGGYLWYTLTAPTGIDGETMAALIRYAGVAALLAIFWPGEGNRHESADLGLQGFLATWTDWDAEAISRFIQLVARHGRDEDWRSRGTVEAVSRTIARVQEGEEVRGRPTLAEALGEHGGALVAEAKKVLGLQHAVRGPHARRQQPPDTRTVHLNVNAPLHRLVDDTITALGEANDPAHGTPTLYVRGGALVRTHIDERDRPFVAAIAIHGFTVEVDRVVLFYTPRENDDHEIVEIPVRPPYDVCQGALAATTYPLPRLTGITETPVMRKDGTVFAVEGYDVATGYLYRAIPGAALVSAVSDKPTDEEVRAAFATLHDVFVDFPFHSPADRANALGLLLTLVMRAALDGNIPLALIDAPAAGTGKGLLADVIAVIATGHPAGTLPEVESDAEWRKQITTALMSGRVFHLIDNLDNTLRSGILANLMTSSEWRDRLLSTNREVAIPQAEKGVWAATGNNLVTAGDLARRCYHIRLDAETARPYLRTGFKHNPLLAWAMAERHIILHAALTVCRAWFARGCPVEVEGESAPVMGSYEAWARTIWGILALDDVCGAAFLANGPELWQQGDEDAEEWETFLRALAQNVGWGAGSDRGYCRPFTAATIAARVRDEYIGMTLRDALPGGLAAAVGKDGFTRQLGRAFRRQAGRRFGDDQIRLERIGNDPHANTALWQVLYDQPKSGASGAESTGGTSEKGRSR